MAAYDLVVVGGGIVGLATAMECLGRYPGLGLILLEKETELAKHQTGHNSGVIHSGIYYRPGSLKAQTCVAGARLMVEFCQHHRIPYQICGKLIVAAEARELPALESLYRRGQANGVSGLNVIGPDHMQDVEPAARGVRAIHVQSTGIVDYVQVAHAFAQMIRSRGGAIKTATAVRGIRRQPNEWIIETTSETVRAKYLVTCGGLFADRLAWMAGAPSDLRIIPFRGDYYDLVPARRSLINSLIYPVPNPSLPFLGVHVTRTIRGGVHVGPNAVLALKREGYGKTDVDLREAAGLLTYPGFWRMARTYWSYGIGELYRACSKAGFVRALQRLVPDVSAEDLVAGASGVRAQAVDRQGRLVDDFNIVSMDSAIHVRNVPSPAATASIKIGQTIAQMIGSAFGL